jgi:branched-chain amino acid aminotransferase
MKTGSFPKAFFQGKVVNIEDAKVSIMTNALQYGTGFFGGIRAYYDEADKASYVFRLDDHITRFLNSAMLLDVKMPYDHTELKKIIIDLIKQNKPETDAYLRPFAYVGNDELGPNLAGITMDFALYMIPLKEYMPVSKGLNLVISKWRRIPDASIPSRAKASGGYINSALARKEATDGGYDEAILLRENGNLSEGSAENAFIVKDGTVITPALSEDILEGITRRSLLQMCKDMNIPTEDRPITKHELLDADEVFLSGTGCQVAWVASIDKQPIGNGKIGPVTEKLQKKFFAAVRGQDSTYSPKWCTKVELG